MGVASGCGEQESGVASGSGWNQWVWLVGVVVRRYIDFLILLIPTPLVSVLFLQEHPYFLFIFLNYNFKDTHYFVKQYNAMICHKIVVGNNISHMDDNKENRNV